MRRPAVRQGDGFSKREMARQFVELMHLLGFDRFAIVGHDRGARVAYRMAFDHPEGGRTARRRYGIHRKPRHPRAADTVGISVYNVRYAAAVLSGMLAALGGAYISVGFVESVNENITAGAGFIAWRA